MYRTRGSLPNAFHPTRAEAPHGEGTCRQPGIAASLCVRVRQSVRSLGRVTLRCRSSEHQAPAHSSTDEPGVPCQRRGPAIQLAPAPAVRQWMQRTRASFANRCLLMLIAKQSRDGSSSTATLCGDVDWCDDLATVEIEYLRVVSHLIRPSVVGGALFALIRRPLAISYRPISSTPDPLCSDSARYRARPPLTITAEPIGAFRSLFVPYLERIHGHTQDSICGHAAPLAQTLNVYDGAAWWARQTERNRLGGWHLAGGFNRVRTVWAAAGLPSG